MQNAKVLSLIGLLMVSAALVGAYALPRAPVPAMHRLPVETFTPQIGGWTANADLPVDDFVQQKLPTAKIVTRDYMGTSGRQVELLLLSAERREDFHDPNECFPGSGWQLTDRRPIQIGGQTVNTMRAERDGVRTRVWYWWAGEVDFEQGDAGGQRKIQALRKFVLHTFGRADGMSLFVRMTAPDTEPGRADLRAFTQTLLPPLKDLWKTANPSGASATK